MAKRRRIKKKKAIADGLGDKLKLNLEDGTKRTITAVILFLLALLSLLGFLNLAGIVGTYWKQGVKLLFGKGGFLLPVLLVVLGIAYLRSVEQKIYKATLAGVALFTLGVLGVLFLGTETDKLWEIAKAGDGGGMLGLIPAYPLLSLFGTWATLLILLGFILIGLLITSNVSWHDIKEKIANLKEKKEEEGQEENENKKDPEKKLDKSVEFKVKGVSAEESSVSRPVKTDSNELKVCNYEPDTEWELPTSDLLSGSDTSPEAGNVEKNAKIIEETFENFGIDVQMGEVSIGPTVTQYTLRPAEGVKLTKVTALTDDLALALAAHPVRIEAPIPGKSLVGVEVPNKRVAIVKLKNILEEEAFAESKASLTFCLGRDVSGEGRIASLEKMPHLLIAGSTGSGKSVSMNTLVSSLLYRNSPRQLKFIMVDPKRVELTMYNGIPHLLTPVITDPDKAINALKWLIAEMERRYRLLEEKGSRNVFSYNERVSDSDEKLPYIVMVIDELADLMSRKGREVEAAIVRLAQMARAVGIHLIVSTQRPSVEVITGLIKANITSRIAFQVPTQIDSRTILDGGGAEKLLGSGDMLYITNDMTKPARIQGAFISEKEVRKIVNFWKDQVKEKGTDEETKEEGAENNEIVAGAGAGQAGASGGEAAGGDDALYEEAKQVVIQMGRASASLLQRRLRIGYARAARIIDMLEENGVVSPGEGAKPRKVLVGSSDATEYQDQNKDQDARGNWDY